jgi:hypothetical protein
VIRYIVESRDLKSTTPLGRSWTVDTIAVDPSLGYTTRAQATASIPTLRAIGPEWARAEYRVTPVSL